MGPVTNGSIGRLARWPAIALVSLMMAACGGGSSAPSSAPTVASTPTSVASAAAPTQSTAPSAALSPIPSKGPATSTFTLAGTKGLTAPVTANEILCDRPSLDGPTIFFLGTSGTAGPQVILFVRAGYVEVRVGTGSATTLHLRSFEGSGVTGFDGATGVQLDSTLKETTPAGTDKGDLGVVTSIKGTLDCGNEGLGSSTIAITGETPLGTLSALTDVLVTCTVVSTGTFVGTTGLSTAGTTPVLVIVTAGPTSLQLAVETKTVSSFYGSSVAGVTTIRSDGASISGDVTEHVAAGATPHVLHLTGEATCGTTVKP